MLADERRGRRASETEAGRLRSRVAALEEELAAGRAALAEAGAARVEVEGLRAALDEARAALAAERERVPEPEAEHEVVAPAPPDEGAGVARALAAAASAVGVLAEAVSVAAAELAPFLPPPPAWPPEATPRRAVAGSGAPAGARVPSRLPPGMAADSREAAQHLVRLPGVIVLVDGYNVTKLARPELGLPEQRRWLTDAAAGLAARSGADVEVVFDGAEDEVGVPAGSPGRTKVRVRWSPAGIEADDVLLDLVEGLPAGRPVVVVSNDKRVASGARRRGANVLSSDQLLVLLGQRPGSA
jgi:predicted RNA-binding protein with PIN domain